MIKPVWIIFAVFFGGLGIWLILLDELMLGYLMCVAVLGWLFVANNTGRLFTEEDDEEVTNTKKNGSGWFADNDEED